MFEHMAFKGTRRIGTRAYEAEVPLLEAIEEISKLLNLKTATVFKELKVVKKQKDSILKKIKLPRTT